jgi:ribonuclease PH
VDPEEAMMATSAALLSLLTTSTAMITAASVALALALAVVLVLPPLLLVAVQAVLASF